MKESYEEELANHFGLQRRGDCGNNVVLSVRAEGHAGQLTRRVPGSEITTFACRSGCVQPCKRSSRSCVSECTDWCVAIDRVPTSSICIPINGFALDSRQEP